VTCLLQATRVPRGAVNRPALVGVAGVFPRGPGQVLKLRAQIKEYVAGQLAACTQPHPAAPDKPFVVRSWTYGFMLLKDGVGSTSALPQSRCSCQSACARECSRVHLHACMCGQHNGAGHPGDRGTCRRSIGLRWWLLQRCVAVLYQCVVSRHRVTQ